MKTANFAEAIFEVTNYRLLRYAERCSRFSSLSIGFHFTETVFFLITCFTRSPVKFLFKKNDTERQIHRLARKK